MCENCKSENSVECAGLKHELQLKFYEAMGYGYECSCSCHIHSDEQTVANFQRFLKEVQAAGITPQLVSHECMKCGASFEQPPHPMTGEAFYYMCPECRAKIHRETKNLPDRHASGLYHGIKK